MLPVGCLFIVLLCASADAAYASTSNKPPDSCSESPRAPVAVGTLDAGQSTVYEMNLPAGRFIRVLVEKCDFNLSVALSDPKGGRIGEWVSWRYGALRLAFVTRSSGVHRVEVKSLERGEAAKAFALKVEVGDATARDRTEEEAWRAFGEAEKLRADWCEDSLRVALGKYEEASARWREARRPHEAAAAMEGRGDIYMTLGEYGLALDAFQTALDMSRAARDAGAEMSALNKIGYAHFNLGHNERALRCLGEVLRALAGRPPRGPTAPPARIEAFARNSIGEINYTRGELKKALVNFGRARALWSEASDRRGKALADLNLGYTYSDSGELSEGRDHFERALALARAAEDRRGEALAVTALGTIHAFFGEPQKALDSHATALAFFRSVGDSRGTAVTLNSIGQAYEDLNDPRSALDYYLLALEHFTRSGDLDAEAVTNYYVGRVYRALGDPDNALARFEQTMALCRRTGKRRAGAYAQLEAAAVHDLRGDHVPTAAQYAAVLELFRQSADRRGEALALNSLGFIRHKAGDPRAALALYGRALALDRATGDRAAEASTLYNLARAESDLGLFDKAAAHTEESVRISETTRTKVGSQELRTCYFASVHDRYGFYIDLLMREHTRRPREGFDAAALNVSERALARSLLELLNESRAGLSPSANPALLEHERELKEMLAAKAEYRMRLLGGKTPPPEMSDLDGEIHRLTGDYQEVLARILEQDPRYASLAEPVPVRLQEIQAELRGEDTLLLEYALGPEHSYLWAVSADSLDSYELPPRADVEQAARDFYRLVTARQPDGRESYEDYEARVQASDAEYRQAAARLSRMLLAPIASRLSSRRLLIVADGALQFVPFDALYEPAPQAGSGEAAPQGYGEPPPLVIRHEVVNIPSASTLSVLRRTARRAESSGEASAAVFADPVFGDDDPRVRNKAGAARGEVVAESQPTAPPAAALRGGENFSRLPATLDEAEAIRRATGGAAKILTGFAATREAAVNGDLVRYPVLHFATHGIVDRSHPELSGLLLSTVDERGASENGFLQLHDIYGLKLSARVVVLSACGTGLGKEMPGEGLVGMTRGFMYAGSDSVVASLWKVDDRATAALMGHFYDAMFREGLPPSAALREAKEKTRAERRWRSPYYWAAFTLQGEYRGRIGASPSQRRSAAPALVALALLLPASATALHLARRSRRVRRAAV